MKIAESSRICTFIGHNDTPSSVYPLLLDAIESLYLRGEADTFYVGDKGAFDAMAARALAGLAVRHGGLDWHVVLSRMPRPGEALLYPTLFPDGLERVPPRLAIVRRNMWMLSRAGTLIACAPYPGNASRFVARARNMGLKVIDLCKNG
jgi:hypothetical protein